MELKHRCNQGLAMGWRLGGLCKLFGQEWEGDVTIVMPATFAQVLPHRHTSLSNAVIDAYISFRFLPTHPIPSPPSSQLPRQMARIIANPSPTELRKAVLQGRRATWSKLSAIQANCGIEVTLDGCVSELNRRRKLALAREEAGGVGVGSAESHPGIVWPGRAPGDP